MHQAVSSLLSIKTQVAPKRIALKCNARERIARKRNLTKCAETRKGCAGTVPNGTLHARMSQIAIKRGKSVMEYNGYLYRLDGGGFKFLKTPQNNI